MKPPFRQKCPIPLKEGDSLTEWLKRVRQAYGQDISREALIDHIREFTPYNSPTYNEVRRILFAERLEEP